MKGWFGIVVMLIICGLAIESVVVFATQKEVVAIVNRCERVVKTDGDSVESKYLVFTDNEVFENTDCWWIFKWNSSDIYGKFLNGHTYRIKVYGYRVPIFSWYRNIVSAQEIK